MKAQNTCVKIHILIMPGWGKIYPQWSPDLSTRQLSYFSLITNKIMKDEGTWAVIQIAKPLISGESLDSTFYTAAYVQSEAVSNQSQKWVSEGDRYL